MIEICAVEASQVLGLRQLVLRPGRALQAAILEGDDDRRTRHLAAFVSGEIIGVASIYKRPFPLEVASSTWGKAWQLRGMAVAPEQQRRGVGRALLDACVQHVARNEGGLLWCNARVAAVGFYRAAGFEIHGEKFEIADVGPHFVMARRVETASST